MSFLAPKERTYLFHALDPLHVGTGGTRIGRVDNLVARDPATRLPKIPGSGLSGAIKDAYDLFTLADPDSKRINKTQRCAGSRGCGKDNCPVCALFGTAPSEDGGPSINARRGIVAFRDALLAAMPVASLKGPCWLVTIDLALRLRLITDKQATDLAGTENIAASKSLRVSGQMVNVGGYLLDCPENLTIKPENITIEALSKSLNFFPKTFPVASFVDLVKRMVVCDGPVFQALCASALEVRTSVTIDPYTGAAEPKKLFTLEAVPTGTFFETRLDFLGGKLAGYYSECKDSDSLFSIIETRGFPYLEISGIGGNVTRGFGRIRFFSYWQ